MNTTPRGSIYGPQPPPEPSKAASEDGDYSDASSLSFFWPEFNSPDAAPSRITLPPGTVICGWLLKKGVLLGNWVRRFYFITISDGAFYLCYKADPADPEPKGRLSLQDFDAMAEDDTARTIFLIEAAGRVVVLRAPNPRERARWLGQLALLKAEQRTVGASLAAEAAAAASTAASSAAPGSAAAALRAGTVAGGVSAPVASVRACSVCGHTFSVFETRYVCETCGGICCGKAACFRDASAPHADGEDWDVPRDGVQCARCVADSERPPPPLPPIGSSALPPDHSATNRHGAAAPAASDTGKGAGQTLRVSLLGPGASTDPSSASSSAGVHGGSDRVYIRVIEAVGLAPTFASRDTAADDAEAAHAAAAVAAAHAQGDAAAIAEATTAAALAAARRQARARAACDPYVVLRFDGHQRSTAMRSGTAAPVWRQDFDFPVVVGAHVLELWVFDYDLLGAHSCIGYARVPIAHLAPRRLYDEWFLLRPAPHSGRTFAGTTSAGGRKKAGKIHLLVFRSATAPSDAVTVAVTRLKDVLGALELAHAWAWLIGIVRFSSPTLSIWIYVIFVVTVIFFPADLLLALPPLAYCALAAARILEGSVRALARRKIAILAADAAALGRARGKWARGALAVGEQRHRRRVAAKMKRDEEEYHQRAATAAAAAAGGAYGYHAGGGNDSESEGWNSGEDHHSRSTHNDEGKGKEGEREGWIRGWRLWGSNMKKNAGDDGAEKQGDKKKKKKWSLFGRGRKSPTPTPAPGSAAGDAGPVAGVVAADANAEDDDGDVYGYVEYEQQMHTQQPQPQSQSQSQQRLHYVNGSAPSSGPGEQSGRVLTVAITPHNSNDAVPLYAVHAQSRNGAPLLLGEQGDGWDDEGMRTTTLLRTSLSLAPSAPLALTTEPAAGPSPGEEPAPAETETPPEATRGGRCACLRWSRIQAALSHAGAVAAAYVVALSIAADRLDEASKQRGHGRAGSRYSDGDDSDEFLLDDDGDADDHHTASQDRSSLRSLPSDCGSATLGASTAGLSGSGAPPASGLRPRLHHQRERSGPSSVTASRALLVAAAVEAEAEEAAAAADAFEADPSDRDSDDDAGDEGGAARARLRRRAGVSVPMLVAVPPPAPSVTLTRMHAQAALQQQQQQRQDEATGDVQRRLSFSHEPRASPTSATSSSSSSSSSNRAASPPPAAHPVSGPRPPWVAPASSAASTASVPVAAAASATAGAGASTNAGSTSLGGSGSSGSLADFAGTNMDSLGGETGFSGTGAGENLEPAGPAYGASSAAERAAASANAAAAAARFDLDSAVAAVRRERAPGVAVDALSIPRHRYKPRRDAARDVWTLVAMLEVAAELLFRAPGNRHDMTQQWYGLRVGLAWLIAALILPPRVLLLAAGTLVISSRIRHSRWPERFRLANDAALDPYRFATQFSAAVEQQ